jgi:hypothetical protein
VLTLSGGLVSRITAFSARMGVFERFGLPDEFRGTAVSEGA